LKCNSNVSKVKALCGATSNVQQMARGQSVILVELIFHVREDQQELWETTCIWNTRFRLRQRQNHMFFGSQFYR